MAHAFGYLRIVLALALGLVAGSGLYAQTPSAQVTRFTVFAAKPLADLAFMPRANANPDQVQFHSSARSPRYEYRGPMPLRFVDTRTGQVVAEASIPAGMRDALLLFMPIETAASAAAAQAGAPILRYQIAVLDDGAGQLPPGGLAIVNLSGLTLGGTVNSERVTLKAGLNPPLAVGGAAKIALSTTSRNRTYQAYAGTATLRRGERALLILFPPFYAGSLEVQSRLLLDVPPGTAVAAPPAVPKAGASKR